MHLPIIEGNPKVAVESVIAWHKKSLPTEEDWEGMRADPDLEKELGEGWFFARSRMPRTWIHKLNQRRNCIAELDEKHYQALRLAQSARSSPLSRCAENIDSALFIAAQRRRLYWHVARAEESRLLAGTESPVSPLTRKVYKHLKAGRARPDSVDYLPKPYDAKTNKRNKEYSYLDSLRRLAREDKLGEADFHLIALLPGNLQRIFGDRGAEYFSIGKVADRKKLPLSEPARSSPLSITRKVYEHLKEGRACPDSEDYLPTFKEPTTNKLNLKYSFLQSLRSHARAGKLGPRSLPPLKFSPLLLNKLHSRKSKTMELRMFIESPKQ